MRIYISATLRNFFGKNAQVSVPENTVRKALANLISTYPEGEKVLFDENNKLRSFIKIYLNGKNLNVDTLWDATLEDDSEILLLPAIAGGAPIEESQSKHVESLISDERRKEVAFDDSEIERFGKHLMLKDIGVKGQKRIKAAKVVVIGVGALGSPVIQYLAAAGVGTIKAIDFDEVSLENLQSQVLHGTRDVKRPKVASAKDKVKNINKNIVFEAVKEQLDASNIEAEIEGYDLVIDCTDNYKARYLINDACALHGIRRDLPVRRSSRRFQLGRRSLPALPIPVPSASRTHPLLCRRWRHQPAPGHHRQHPGKRSTQAHFGHR